MGDRKRKSKTDEIDWWKLDPIDLMKNLPTQTRDRRRKPNNQLDKKPPNPNKRWGRKTEQFWNKIRMI